MENFLEQLVGLIEKETVLCESLLAMLQRKKAAIVDGQMEQLGGLGLEIERLQNRIGQAEEMRLEMIARACRHLNCEPAELNLRHLSQMAPSHQASRLDECRGKLLSTFHRIKAINRDIRSLLSHGIELVGMSMNVLCGMMVPHYVYGNSGAAVNGAQSGRIVSQTI